jgi:hypothetical protein
MKIFRDIAQCKVTKTGKPSIVMTTGAVDSENDRMLQDQLTFRIPLRVMVSHDYRELPVGQVDTHSQITRSGDTTAAEFRWLTGDERADRVRNAFEQGMLGASIGMTAVTRFPNEFGGYDISGRVHEVSLTAVPANEQCESILRSVFGSGRPGPLSPARTLNRAPGWWLPRDATLTLVDSKDDLVRYDERDLRAAFAEVFRREVQRQMNLLTGRVD